MCEEVVTVRCWEGFLLLSTVKMRSLTWPGGRWGMLMSCGKISGREVAWYIYAPRNGPDVQLVTICAEISDLSEISLFGSFSVILNLSLGLSIRAVG